MISRIAITVFGLNIYWYGITYAVGFVFAYVFIIYFSDELKIEREKIDNIFFWAVVISVLMGRIFHIIFYEPEYYLNNISQIIRFDRGGMSIHGGIFGAGLVLYYFSKKYEINFLKISDLFVIPSGLALAFGRLANFVNQELVGKITDSSIGVVFQKYDNNLRYPTTLFESAKNFFVFQVNLFQFFILKSNETPGLISAWFLILFNFLRFFIDFLRVPEVLIFNIISMGQLLSLIFGFFGIILLVKIKYKKKSKKNKKGKNKLTKNKKN